MSQYWIARDGRRFGPYAEDHVRARYANRELPATDLVWTEGMAEWLPLGKVFGSSPPPLPAAAAPAAAGASPYRPPAARVAEPAFAADAAYGGFWARFGALMIDSLLLVVGMLAVGGIVGGFVGGFVGAFAGDSRAAVAALGGGIQILAIVLVWLYFALMESGGRGATLGKRAFNLRVAGADDLERISFARATGRYFARWISMLILYLGYLMQPFTQRKQALHDMICGTVVVSLAPASGALIALAVILGLMIPGVGILAAIAIPAYSDYTVRAKVSEALMIAMPARNAVTEHVAAQREFPRSLDDAGFRLEPNQRVERIVLDPRSGALTITFAFDPLAGKTMVLVPDRGSGDNLTWTCRPGSTPRKHLPASCRAD